MRIWIDLANSPHVLLFRPMIAAFERRGHTVVLTARDFAQTVALAERYAMPVTIVGRHGGANLVRKSAAVLDRARDLAAFARRERVELSVHHNSYAQAVASRMIGVPTVALMDYEYQPANHVSFRLASRVMVPAAIPASVLMRYGCRGKLEPYDGIKEDLYVPSYPADDALRDRLGVGDEVLAVVRPAPDMAAYHRFHNPLFDELIDRLDEAPGVRTLLFPRTEEQRRQLQARDLRHVSIAKDVCDGIALLRAADLVVTAGGTMGREAVAAGTPAYSVFQGRLGAVDRHLADAGLLTILSAPADLDRLSLKRKTVASTARAHADLLDSVTDRILSVPAHA